MSQSANLWPKGDNKDLIIAVANYLQTLLNENQSLDEVSVDSLQVATESLQTIICPDDDSLPPAPFTLTQLYELYSPPPPYSAPTDNQEEEKKQALPLPANIEKRREKFIEFIQVLKKHGFFKGCSEGSKGYVTRMEKARIQYNSRFANMSIDSLQWLQLTTATPPQPQAKQPMDMDDVPSDVIVDIKMAESLKGEGNKLLGQKSYKQAVDKYSQAIKYNPQNAVYYSNRAAAYTYLRNYTQAVDDARKASEIDPNYVKAYVREGLAEFEMGNYQNAHDAYSKALNKTKSTDKNWETYMEKVELCQMKIDEANNATSNEANNANADGNAAPDFSSLLSGLGGGGGADGGGLGGMDFSKIMQNPMMQQMAQQMMQDPNAMKKMGNLMKQFGGGGGGGMGANDDNNNNVGGGGGGDVNAIMADLLKNPEKAQGIFTQAMDDPEVTVLLQEDPSIEPLINRIKTGDYSAFMELGSKPKAMAKVKQLIQKYYK